MSEHELYRVKRGREQRGARIHMDSDNLFGWFNGENWKFERECKQSPYGRHEYHFRSYCGADVCAYCEQHKGLARCYCGWGLPKYPEYLEPPFDEPVEPE